MNIHKNTLLTPHSRQGIWRAHTQDKQSVTSLAAEYKVGRPTIYRILKAARLKLLVPQKSTNNRFKQARYGMKRLAKVEREIEERLKNQTVADPFEYLFVAIDGYSREPYAAILPDRTAAGAAKFLLRDVIDCCPYTVECAYSDNGVEYKGNASHPFGAACRRNNIVQKFTRIARPQTNGKAERVIRTLTEMWHEKQTFTDAQQRRRDLRRFANFYNTVKPHRSLNGNTPFEVLETYFAQPVV